MGKYLSILLILIVLPILFSCSRNDILIADFEGSEWGDWQVEGEAFGPGPASSFSGAMGEGMVNTYVNRFATGTMTSPPFSVQRRYLVFLLGGGYHPDKLCINLLQDGQPVMSATTNNNIHTFRIVEWRFFDLKEIKGQEIQIQILDGIEEGWGQLMVDHFYLSDKIPVEEKSIELPITKKFINLPVRTGDPKKRMQLFIDDELYNEFNIELADSFPEFYVFVDVEEFNGQKATLIAPSIDKNSKAFDFISIDDEIKEAEDLYREPMRQQFHFSSRRGWNNDPNGLVFHDGEYHLFYQHNPFGWSHGNMHWGHAVSTDLVHWLESPTDGVFPRAYGKGVWSGGGMMDYQNTAGFKTGDEDVMIVSYTTGGHGEAIEYSLDRGRTFTWYEGNPVVKHEGRDPKILWYEPGQHWVMVVYHEEAGKRWIAFYTSDDLKDWTYQSKNEGYFECPELFELPVDGNPNKKKWILYAADGAYALGSFDGKVFTPETDKYPNNYGNCFYASQTFSNIPDEDGRRIQMAWGRVSTPGMPFNQCMLFPVTLTLKTTSEGVRMFSEPVKEIELLHKSKEEWSDEVIGQGSPVIAPGELYHIKGDFSVGDDSEFGLKIHGADMIYNAANQELSCMDKTAPLKASNGRIYLEILVDRNTIEIFCNQGEVYMPIGRDLTKDYGVEFISSSGKTTANSLQVYELESIWK
jgi:fructan beta-fructosidase